MAHQGRAANGPVVRGLLPFGTETAMVWTVLLPEKYHGLSQYRSRFDARSLRGHEDHPMAPFSNAGHTLG